MQSRWIFHLLRGRRAAISRRAALRLTGASILATATGVRPALAAQDATPAATGPLTELLGAGLPSGVPGQSLQLIRFTLMPGETTDPHVRPGARVNYVDRGRWAVTVVEGPVALQPTGGDRLVDREELVPGSEYMLEPGDSLFIDEGAVIASRSAGDEPLVLWTAALSPSASPTTSSIPVGTPAATPEA